MIKHSTYASFDWNSSWLSASVWKSSRAVDGVYGTAESEIITGLLPMVTYYFRIKTYNSDNTASNMSNISTGVASGIFSAVTTLTEIYNTYRLSAGDYDNDGLLDLALANDGQVNRIYRNLGNNSFGLTASLSYTDDSCNIAWGDYDNDGFLDLAVGNGNAVLTTPNRVYHNNQNGSFNAVWTSTESSCVSNISWGDYDNDGFLDLVISNFGQATQIYHNNGNHQFSLSWITPMVGVSYDSGRSVAWGDYDNDGDLDFVLANDGEANRVYKNNGNGSFTLIWSSVETDNSWCVAWGDYDNDGDLDLVFGNENQPCRVYQNAGMDIFALTWSSSESLYARNVVWGDYNNDGYLDLALANYGQTGAIYRNNRNNTFSLAWTSEASYNSWGNIWSDFDNDGDLDLAASVYGSNNRVYQSYVSTAVKTNIAPNPPGYSSMNAIYNTLTGAATFYWDSGSDTETPTNGLYYNVRITTFAVGGQTIYSSATPLRYGSPLLGNYLRLKLTANQLGLRIRNLPVEKIYYWSVQTIDSGLKAGSWSTEKTITAATPPSTITDLSFLPGFNVGEIKLLWTSPGDDGTIGQIINGKWRVAYSSYPAYPFQLTDYQLQVTTTATPGQHQTLSVTGLSPTVTYYFCISTADEVPCWSELSNLTTGTATATLPPPPTNVSISQVLNEIYIQWDAANVSVTPSYRIYCDTASPADNFYLLDTSLVTNYTHPNLTSGNTYYYKITTVLSDVVFLESASYSTMVSTCIQTILPFMPTSFLGTATSTSKINWTWQDNSYNEFGYRIFSTTNTNVSFTNIIDKLSDLPPNTTFWIETGLTANTPYTRYVAAYNSAGQIYSASWVSYTLANPPTNTHISSITYQSLTLSWTPGIGGNKYYKIEMTEGGDTPSNWLTVTSLINGFSGTSKDFPNLVTGTTYWFRVYGCNEEYTETTADVVVSTVVPMNPEYAPANFTGEVRSTIAINWSWIDKCANEDGYRILDKNNSIIATLPADTTYYIETGLSPNTLYERKTQLYASGLILNSNSTGYYTFASIPNNLATSNLINSQLSLTWNGDGTRYKVEHAADTTGTKKWTEVGTTTDSVSLILDTGLKTESTYWYRITAYNGNSIPTEPSDETSFITAPNPASGAAGITLSTTSIKWVWNDNTTTEFAYTIQSSTSNDLSFLLSANTTSCTETGLESNTIYSRYIIVHNDIGYSSSTIANKYTFADVPYNLQSLGTTYGTAALSWEGNGTWYGVDRSVDGITFTGVTEICTEKTFTDSGLEPLTTYFYRVRAYNGDRETTGPSVSISTCTADVPPSIIGTAYDSEGNVLESVYLVVSSTFNAVASSVYSNDHGYYEIRYIPNGDYTLTATKSGYTTRIKSNIRILILYTATVNFILPLIQQNEITWNADSNNVVNLGQGKSLTLGYNLVQPSHTKIQVYNINGQSIATLLDEDKPAGSYMINWAGKDDQNKETVGSGIYMVIFQTNAGKQIKKVIIVK